MDRCAPRAGELKPDLFRCAMLCLEDACPPEPRMQLCRMQEDDGDGSACRRCWEHYLLWVANGRRGDPYRRERLYDGGMVG